MLSMSRTRIRPQTIASAAKQYQRMQQNHQIKQVEFSYAVFELDTYLRQVTVKSLL